MRMGTNMTMLLVVALMAFAAWVAVSSEMVILPWADETETVDKSVVYGPLFIQPDKYDGQFLAQKWVRDLDVGTGTFAEVLPSQVRISVSGSGPMTGRKVVAETKGAASLFEGRRQQRATDAIHGLLDIAVERRAYMKGISFSTTESGFVATWLATDLQLDSFIYADGDAQAKQWGREVIDDAEAMRQMGVLAYYEFNSTWIVLGPEVSKTFVRSINTPRKVKAKEGMYAAYVLRHELEHAVTATSRMDLRESWMEEASAETLARWPGSVPKMARAMGLPYSKAAETTPYDDIIGRKLGYDDQVDALRAVLGMAGLNHRHKAGFAKADKLLQHRPIEHAEETLAASIIEHQGLKPALEARLARRIAELDGSPSKARRLATDVKRKRI